MLKRTVKYIALFFMLSALLICFSSCKNKKDVYGAASDFIKVSHPEKPNTNVFSDENYNGNTSSESAKGGSETADSDSSNTSSDPLVSSNSQGSEDSTSSSTGGLPSDVFEVGGNLNSTPIVSGDQGPVVDVP